jgi:hypothetical protein
VSLILGALIFFVICICFLLAIDAHNSKHIITPNNLQKNAEELKQGSEKPEEERKTKTDDLKRENTPGLLKRAIPKHVFS